jgi:glycosyltransferase involved in cell wall biosynthesis
MVYPRRDMRLTRLVTPMKPLEAMALGRLVAASDIGGHRELIRNGETGVLFEAGSPDALSRTLFELLDAPERWPELRNAGRRYVESERTWEQGVARAVELYESLLGTTARPRDGGAVAPVLSRDEERG